MNKYRVTIELHADTREEAFEELRESVFESTSFRNLKHRSYDLELDETCEHGLPLDDDTNKGMYCSDCDPEEEEEIYVT